MPLTLPPKLRNIHRRATMWPAPLVSDLHIPKTISRKPLLGRQRLAADCSGRLGAGRSGALGEWAMLGDRATLGDCGRRLGDFVGRLAFSTLSIKATSVPIRGDDLNITHKSLSIIVLRKTFPSPAQPSDRGTPCRESRQGAEESGSRGSGRRGFALRHDAPAEVQGRPLPVEVRWPV